MPFKEKDAIKIVFSIDNNIYLINDINIINYLYKIKEKYQKYIKNNSVMSLNLYKITRSFIEDFISKNDIPEIRGLNNIINTFKDILNNKKEDIFYEMVEEDLNTIIYYRDVKK